MALLRRVAHARSPSTTSGGLPGFPPRKGGTFFSSALESGPESQHSLEALAVNRTSPRPVFSNRVTTEGAPTSAGITELIYSPRFACQHQTTRIIRATRPPASFFGIHLLRLLGFKVMTIQQILPYVVMLAAAVLLIFVGSTLLFAPRKFLGFARHWGKRIHFPESAPSDQFEQNINRGWRFPGLFLFCFGSFLLFVILRSLFHELHSWPPIRSGSSVPPHRQTNWLQYFAGLLPIAFGIFILVRTNAILRGTAKQESAGRPIEHKLGATRLLFRVVGIASIITGLVQLIRVSFHF